MKSRRLARAVVLAVVASAFPGCAAGDASGTFVPLRHGTLTVVTQPLPTAGFWEGKGNRPTGGLEFAIAQELAKRLEVHRLAVRTEQFSAIVRGDLGGADLAMALITPTEDRDQVLDFSSPYIRSPPAFLVRAGTDIPDVQTAQGLRFAVGANTTFENILADVIQPEQPPARFEDRAQEVAAIRDGRADAAVFDLPAAEAIVNDDPRLEVAAKLADTEPIAVALPEGSPNTQAVSAALRAMGSDGTIDRLATRWLGVSISDSYSSVPLLRTSEP